MKKVNFILAFVLLHHCANGFLLQLIRNLIPGPQCITLTQLLRATSILCHEQRQNKTLWKEIIECHRPMDDEFMRFSAEALCPNPKFVQDPTDERYSIEDVFFNICGVVDGNPLQVISTGMCITLGTDTIPSHAEEVTEMKSRWGPDLRCNIGKCTKRLMGLMGFNLGF